MKTIVNLAAAAVIAVSTTAALADEADAPAAVRDDLVVEVDTGELVSVQRERVAAELNAAHSLGLLTPGEGDMRWASVCDQRAITAAGEAAVQRLELARRELLAVKQWGGRAK